MELQYLKFFPRFRKIIKVGVCRQSFNDVHHANLTVIGQSMSSARSVVTSTNTVFFSGCRDSSLAVKCTVPRERGVKGFSVFSNPFSWAYNSTGSDKQQTKPFASESLRSVLRLAVK